MGRHVDGKAIYYVYPNNATATTVVAAPAADEAFLRLTTAAGGTQEAYIEKCDVTFSTDSGMQLLFWVRENAPFTMDDEITGKVMRPDGTLAAPATAASGTLEVTQSVAGTIRDNERKEQRFVHSGVGYSLKPGAGIWVPANEQYMLMLGVKSGTPNWSLDMKIVYPNG